MATLTTSERQQIWRGLMRLWSNPEFVESLGLTKTDLMAAVEATDTWIDANAAAYNLALPVLARTNLSAAQKTLLFCAVAARRVSKGFAQSILGEVD